MMPDTSGTNAEARSAAPFARAMTLALAGQPIPPSLIAQIVDEGGDFNALLEALRRHSRA